MKKFLVYHRIFIDSPPEVFTEEYPPFWLTGREAHWWYHDHVLTLDIGEKVKSDFRVIQRIE